MLSLKKLIIAILIGIASFSETKTRITRTVYLIIILKKKKNLIIQDINEWFLVNESF